MPLTNPQKIIAQDTRRFKVAVCGRRFWQDSPRYTFNG